MMILKSTTILLCAAFCFISLHLASGQYSNLIVGGKALTIKAPNPGYNVVWEPLRISDDSQAWSINGGYIESKQFPGIVLDVKNNVAKRARVIGFQKKNPPLVPLNQLWTIKPDGSIESRKAAGLYLTSEIVGGVEYALVNFISNPPSVDVQPQLLGPLVCTSWGDPHFTRFDGAVYHYQGTGDYVLTTFSGTQVQARQQLCFANGVTCNVGVVVKTADTGARIEILEGDIVKVNGVPITVTGSHTVSPAATITKISAGNYVVTVPCGTIGYTQYPGHAGITATVTCGPLPAKGLCNNTPRGVVTTRSTVSADQAFGDSWRVRNISESHFTYYPGAQFGDINKPDAPQNYGPYTNPDPNIVAQANQICNVLASGPLVTSCAPFKDAAFFHEACVNDIIATGQVSQGDGSIDAFTIVCTNEAARQGANISLSTSAAQTTASGPGLTSPVIGGEEVPVYIRARSASGAPRTTGGDDFVVFVSGDASDWSVVEDHNDGTYSFTYYQNKVGEFTVSITLGGQHISGSPFSLIAE